MMSIQRFFQSIISVAEDAYFDKRFGINTSEVVEVSELDISEADKSHAVRYKPTRVRYFREFLKRCQIPKDNMFVDVGCGLGRVLLLAHRYGFKDVVGIELSPTLADGARRNFTAYEKRSGESTSNIQVHVTNILDYELTDRETVFFLFWPFDRTVTIAFLNLLRESLRRRQRNCWLVINEFQFRDLLEGDPVFEHQDRIVYGAAEFDVYVAVADQA